MLNQLPSIRWKIDFGWCILCNSKFSCFGWLFYYRLVWDIELFRCCSCRCFFDDPFSKLFIYMSSYSLKSAVSRCKLESRLDKRDNLPFLLLCKVRWFHFDGNLVCYQLCVLHWSFSLNSVYTVCWSPSEVSSRPSTLIQYSWSSSCVVNCIKYMLEWTSCSSDIIIHLILPSFVTSSTVLPHPNWHFGLYP